MYEATSKGWRYYRVSADAIDEVKEICDYVSERDGGDGAVREFIRWLVKQREVVVM